MRLESLYQDIAFVCRSYRRQPGVALTALVTLTLGIGACSAIFSVIRRQVHGLSRSSSSATPDRVLDSHTRRSFMDAAGVLAKTDADRY